MSTAVVGIIGSPVGHSLTPTLQRAAFSALGIDCQSVAFDVPAGGGAAAVAGMRGLGIRGLSVTMPLKAEAAAAADVLSPQAAALRSVNCLSLEDGLVHGTSTDGDGLIAALDRSLGLSPEGLDVAILGSGGAARSVAEAMGRAGASSVLVVARRPDAAAACASLAGDAGRAATADEAIGCGLVINATPIGMAGTEAESAEPLVDPSRLRAGQIALDLVYHPSETPWLAAAGEAGARTSGGLGMLVHQAALQIEIWTGSDAPVDAMWEAATAALGSR